MHPTALLALLAAGFVHPVLVHGTTDDVHYNLDTAAYSPADIIERDVVIVGGGSTGTYSAVRLRDHNKTVVVVEKKDTLGGHAETYVNPFTGYTVDIGVVVFSHLKVVTDYFARFDVPLVNFPITLSAAEYVDFASGEPVEFQLPSQDAFMAALDSYATQLERYPELQGGFNMSYPVPPDLLLSFRDFVEKYQLQDLVSRVFITNQGFSPLLDLSMLYIFKYLNAAEVDNFKEGFLTTVNHDIQELYQKATAFLGPDVLLGSTVVAMDRSSPGPYPVRVNVQTPTGPKLITAKKIISTVPPKLENLGPYDLSQDEKALFGQFYANGYYTGILNNTGITEPLTATGPGQPYNVPTLPGLYNVGLTAENLTQVYYGSPEVMSDDEVKADIMASIRRIQEARGIPIDVEPDWLIFSSHAPFNLMVSNEAIQNGFYRDLYALQGQRNTFYDGAAWHTQDSSVLWEFTENYVLPICLASL
ncbi:FAD/NAD(P)-binding domain-containing protein [Biscogniauxia mediterranea]|nr:FAD/NAD(P)-binding domain-containing protein [Biscogniauxia mediterranea]